MRFLRLLASMIGLALIAGLPLASAHAATADCTTDCTTVSAAAGSGCCGGTDVASCSMACAAPAAIVGKVRDLAVQLDSGSLLQRYAARTHSISRPPDTAPPKHLPA